MIVNQMEGMESNAKETMAELNKKLTISSQQANSDREARIMDYNTRIDALANELDELKDKEKLCQSMIERIDSAIGKLYDASGRMTEIVGNLDNALKVTSISKNNIDGVKDIIINNVSLLMNNIVLLNEKSQEIQKEIKEKKDLIDNLIRARNSLL